MNKKQTFLLIALVAFGTFSRLVPHAPNFTPLTAICFAAGVYLPFRWLKLVLPLVTIWLSDLYLNNVVYGKYNEGFKLFYDGWHWLYFAWLLVALVGSLFSIQDSFLKRLAGVFGAGILFFFITNLACWPNNPQYSQNFSGALQSLIAGIPFYWNSLAADLVYFSLFSLITQFYIAPKSSHATT